ncbi:MAG: hypothetical protein IJ493_09265 [Clostridia bacterium]|nr:hypothetical protein [Clostridia bacterium]
MKLLTIIFLLSALLLLPACADEPAPPEDTTAITESAPAELRVTEGGQTDFYIIRADYSSQAVTNQAIRLRKAIIDATGATPGINTDWEKNPTYEHELIIGETLRETEGFIDRRALGESGYIIRESGGKIYISGGSDKGTKLAMDFFLDTFVTSGSDVIVPVGYEYVVYHQYDIPALYIDMVQLDDSRTIVLPPSADKTLTKAAETLRDTLYKKTGLYLSIVTEATDACAILLSEEKPETAGVHEIYVDGGRLVLTSGAGTGLAGCAERFVSLYLEGKTGSWNFPADFRYLDLGDHIVIKFPE